jgi:hypothetical protein
VNSNRSDRLASFVAARIDEQEHRCMTALERDLPMDVHLALSVALVGCQIERHVLNRWQLAVRESAGSEATQRVAAALEVGVMMMARTYRHHPDFDDAAV